MKVCKKEKPYSEFYKRPGFKDGHRNSCKECWKKSRKEYVEKNDFGDKNKKYKKLYEEGYKVCNGCKTIKPLNEYWKRDDGKNVAHLCKNCFKKLNKRNYLKNKEKRMLEAREYRKTHKDTRKRTNTVQDYISIRVSGAIRYSLKRVGKKKNNRKWEGILGYGATELMKHFNINSIEELKGKEIDHIIPISAYNYKDVEDEDFKKCWNINNLRLIPARENSSKINKIDVNLIKENNIEYLFSGRVKPSHS